MPPAITALDGPGSEGLSLRQSYTVTILKKVGTTWTTVFSSGAAKLYAVPANVGPRTMPNYASLAQQGVYSLAGGIRVFAGTVDDPFYIDLGGAFDTLNFRPGASGIGVPGVLSDAQDADDTRNFAADAVSGFNVNTIAIELPTAMLTRDGALHAADRPGGDDRHLRDDLAPAHQDPADDARRPARRCRPTSCRSSAWATR